ncbi:MAG: hydrogenase iron-sulfur subunit, partial [Candidatus Hodarchaeales archaeon]
TTLTKMFSADHDLEKHLKDLKSKLTKRKNVMILTDIIRVEKTGHMGNFTIKTFSMKGTEKVIEAGIIVFSGDFKEFDVSKLGNIPDIDGKKTCTWSNFNPSGLKKGSKVLIVSCIGSRSAERSYCSSYCCEVMVEKARELADDYDVTVLHKGIRTLGKRELAYLDARNKGVKFIQGSFTLAENLDDSFIVTTENTLLQQQVELRPDTIIFSSALLPPEEAVFLDDFGLTRLENGFIDPLYAKLRTERTAVPGVLVSNSMLGPSLIDELIDSSKSLALEVFKLLGDKITKKQHATVVDENKCTGCEICVQNCPAAAIDLNDNKKASVDQNTCILCGLCTTVCPSGAITVENRDMKLLDEKIVTIAGINEKDKNSDPLIYLMACSECGQAAVNMITELEEDIPPVIPVTVSCGSSISLTSLLRCFDKGASGVVIAVCHHCHKGKGHDVASGVANIASQVLDHAGLGGWRIKTCQTYANQPDALVSALTELEMQIAKGGR